MKKTPQHKTDREYMLSPNDWPRWPICPLKRSRDRSPNCGIIVGDPTKDGRVYFVEGGNIWHIDDEFNREHGGFRLVDDLIAEGWMVD